MPALSPARAPLTTAATPPSSPALARAATRTLTLSSLTQQAGYRRLQNLVIYSSLWLSAGLASMALFTAHALGLSWNLGPAMLVFASSMFIYNLDHVADAQIEAGKAASGYFERASVLLLVLCSGVATAVMFAMAPAAARVVFLGYLSVGLVYGIPLLPIVTADGLRWFRLKDIPGAKGWIVAAAITLAVVGLPLAWSGATLGMDGLWVAAFFFTFVASGAHMCDVRDVDDDRASGVRTLPIQAGVAGTKTVLIWMNLGMLCLMMVGALGGVTGPHPEFALVVAATILYVRYIDEDSPEEAFNIMLDGCFYLPAPLGVLHEVLH